MNEQQKFMVCVKCHTFNHAPYIVDAMEGFSMQKTNFPFVCVIVDDASTDGEQDVIKNYVDEHFDFEDKRGVRNEETDDYVLTFVRHKANVNCFFAVFYLKWNHHGKKLKAIYFKEWADSKYIALCEGDDYWTEPLKLQKQVDYLETHPDFSGTAHQCEIIGSGSGLFNKNVPNVIGMRELALGSRLFHTASFVYRGKDVLGLPPIGKPVVSGDKLLFLETASLGKIKFFVESMAVYRKHDAGMHSIVKIENLKKDKAIAYHMKSICPKFPLYRYLSFLYGTFAMYPKDISPIEKAWYLLVSFVLSFSYFPENIRTLLKKVYHVSRINRNNE